jgi:hypothetical protein
MSSTHQHNVINTPTVTDTITSSHQHINTSTYHTSTQSSTRQHTNWHHRIISSITTIINTSTQSSTRQHFSWHIITSTHVMVAWPFTISTPQHKRTNTLTHHHHITTSTRVVNTLLLPNCMCRTSSVPSLSLATPHINTFLEETRVRWLSLHLLTFRTLIPILTNCFICSDFDVDVSIN